MAASHRQSRYSAAEYLAYERETDTKSEYIAGQIVAMSGSSLAHNRINVNLLRILSTQTLDGPCETFSGDMRVKVTAQGMYTYPDLSMVCGEPQFEDTQVDTLLNPTLIIEVLSPSTERYDRGAKFGYYRALPSLQAYLLVAQDRMLVEQFVRDGDGWRLTVVSDPAAGLPLPAIGCTLPLAEVYRRVGLATDAAANEEQQ